MKKQDREQIINITSFDPRTDSTLARNHLEAGMKYFESIGWNPWDGWHDANLQDWAYEYKRLAETC